MVTIDELEEYFKSAELPEEIYLSSAEKITDVRKFIEGHLRTLRSNSGQKVYLPYYERLRKVKELNERRVS